MSVIVSVASLILFIREQASSRRAWRVLFAATAADGTCVRIAQSAARRVIYMFVPRTCTRMPAALLHDVVCRLPEKARIRHTLVPTSPWTQISRSQNVRQIYLCTPERTSLRATMMVSSGEDACHIYKSLGKETLLLLARRTPCSWVHRPILDSAPSIHSLRSTEDVNAHAHDDH